MRWVRTRRARGGGSPSAGGPAAAPRRSCSRRPPPPPHCPRRRRWAPPRGRCSAWCPPTARIKALRQGRRIKRDRTEQNGTETQRTGAPIQFNGQALALALSFLHGGPSLFLVSRIRIPHGGEREGDYHHHIIKGAIFWCSWPAGRHWGMNNAGGWVGGRSNQEEEHN